MYSRFALILALTISIIPACNKGKKTPAKSEEAAPAEKQQKSFEQLLSMIPAGSPSVAVVLNWDHLLRLSSDVQGALKHSGTGQVLLGRIHSYSSTAPIPLPIGAREMKLLGLDPTEPMAVFGGAAPLAVFSLKDSAAFQDRLATAYGKATWKDSTFEGLKLRHLSGARELYCLPIDRSTICSPSAAALATAVKERPQQSIWSTLSEEDRGDLPLSAALIGFSHPTRMQGLALLKVEDDGVSARMRLGGRTVGQITSLLGGKGAGSLQSLTQDAPTVIYLRAQVSEVLNALRAMLPNLRQLGLDPIRLSASLTGELLLRETADRKLLLVLGSRDPAVSQIVVEALAALLKKLSPEQNTGGGAPSIPITITPEGKEGSHRYKIQFTSSAAGIPLKLTLGLAAGAQGVLLGSSDAVAALAKTASGKGKAKEPGKGKNQGGNTTLLIARTPLADPLRQLNQATVALFKAAGLPEGIVENIQLARFLLDQMHGQTLTITSTAKDQVLLNLRWTTLHQHGIPGSNEARELWLKALAAQADGEPEKAKRILGTLVKEQGKTRFAKRAGDQRPSMLSALLTTVLASTALPAYQQYSTRSRQAEAYSALARMAMAGRFSFRSPGTAPNGKPLPRRFPATTDWSPPTRCCESSGGECQPAPGIWMTPAWKALRFTMDAPHRFQYRFVNKGVVGGKARFLAQARGDVECSGRPILFTIEGKQDDEGTVTLSQMKSAPARAK